MLKDHTRQFHGSLLQKSGTWKVAGETHLQLSYDNNTTKYRNKKRNVPDRSIPLFFLIARIFHTERIPTEKTHTDIKYSNGIT